MFKQSFKLFIALILLVFLTSACTFPWERKNIPTVNKVASEESPTVETAIKSGGLKKFSDLSDLKSFLIENPTIQASGEKVAAASIFLNNFFTNDQSSKSNEPDILKTDGTYIYALVRNEVLIIKANPENSVEVLSRIKFTSDPAGLLINGSSLTVFGLSQQVSENSSLKNSVGQGIFTFLKVYDVSDQANPKEVRNLNFAGTYIGAKMLGNYIYFITDSKVNYISGESPLPKVLENGSLLSSDCKSQAKCFAQDVFYFDISYDNYSYVSVTAINVKDNKETISGQIFLLNSGQKLYVSENNIYITYTNFLNSSEIEYDLKRNLFLKNLDQAAQDKISKIEAVDSFVLSNNEKKLKIGSLIDYYFSLLGTEQQKILSDELDSSLILKLKEKGREPEKTVIHKISFSEGKIAYRAKGEVNGRILNQSSINEDGNYLRLATARSPFLPSLNEKTNDSYSSVYILDKDLKIAGKLENLATSEKINEARFIGGRVFLITSKKSDPLYIINLEKPSEPVVSGALKIPEEMDYLQPIDKDGMKFIGLGRDSGNVAGDNFESRVKLSLFDFSDLSVPKELGAYLIGDEKSDSFALSDYQSLLYLTSKNLISIPGVLRENNGRLSFSGAIIFEIKDNDLSLIGKIDHSAGGNFMQIDNSQGYAHYDNTVKRGLYLNNQLYTLSNKFLKINNPVDLTEIKSLILTTSFDDYIINQVEMEPMDEPASEDSPANDINVSTDMDGNIETDISDAEAALNQALGSDPGSSIPESLIDEVSFPSLNP